MATYQVVLLICSVCRGTGKRRTKRLYERHGLQHYYYGTITCPACRGRGLTSPRPPVRYTVDE